jgi:DNA-binding PadR family transcriptional regulator
MSVRHALLALLSEGPTYGLRLRQEFEACTGEAWPLNVGQVYSTLQRLERDGFVEAADATSGTQRSYSLTSEGREELEGWLATPPDAAPPRDELLMKVLVAARVPSVDMPRLLQAHRKHLLSTMRTFTKVKEDAAEDDWALLLVADAEIFRLDAIVRWLDSTEARLRRIPRSPTGRDASEAVRRQPVRP